MNLKTVYMIGAGKSRSTLEREYNAHKGAIYSLNRIRPMIVSEIEHVHFDMHSPRHHSDESILELYRGNEDKIKIFTHDMFPFEDISKMCPVRYFSSSVAYMIAYAVYTGYERIVLLGMDRFYREHNPLQVKAGIEFWLAFAKGRGCRIITAARSYLLRQQDDFLLRNFDVGYRLGTGELKEVPKMKELEYLTDERNFYI